jgi:predicted DsbA family dithiol-disulfide isomerase
MFVLEATEYAQQHGKFLEFHWAAYKAFWEDGQDLGDLAVIEAVAQSVDLNSTELIERLESKYYSSTVMDQYQEALQYGINGIPTFLVGNLLFTGAQPYDIFKTAIDRVLSA